MKKLSMIAAMSENRVIGRNNRLPWKMPADLENFNRVTQGKPFIMGRNSYLAPDKLISSTLSIILSHTEVPGLCEKCIRVDSWDAAFSMVADESEVFILGGQSVFTQAMTFANYLYLTVIHARISGDAFFPDLDDKEWNPVSRRFHHRDPENPYDYTFIEYVRI